MQRLRIGPIDLLGCHDALARLDDYVDRELSASEMSKVRFHLRICRRCAERFAFEAEIEQGLREKLARLDVPESLKEKVARAIRD
jgi:anti-sigma factor (TIGR02949 family)